MRIILKILAVPVLGLLALTVAVCSFALVFVGVAGGIVSVLLVIGGVVLLFAHYIAGGIALLVIAFLVSPFGIPAIAVWMVDKINALRYSLKDFIRS
jgi:hypothetical protein